MMRFELGLEEPEEGRAMRSALTIAVSYICGGLIPLTPYMTMHSAHEALLGSVGVTLSPDDLRLCQGPLHRHHPIRGAIQTTVVGGLAAGAAFLLARIVSLANTYLATVRENNSSYCVVTASQLYRSRHPRLRPRPPLVRSASLIASARCMSRPGSPA